MIVTKEKRKQINTYRKRAITLYKQLKNIHKTSEALGLEGIKRSGSWVAIVLKQEGILKNK